MIQCYIGTAEATDSMTKQHSAVDVGLYQRNYNTLLGEFKMLTNLPDKDFAIAKTIVYETTWDKESNEWVVKYNPLGIVEHHKELKKAIANFKNYLLDLYEDFLSFEDSKLSQEMLLQKRHIQEIIIAK
jgi:hypothetical protein